MNGIIPVISRLAAGILIPIILVTLTVYFLLWSHLHDRIESEYRTAEISLNSAYSVLSKEMGDTFQSVLAVQEIPIVKNFFASSHDASSRHRETGTSQPPERLDRILERFLSYFGRYNRLTLIGMSGDELLSVHASKFPDIPPLDHSQADYFLEALKLNKHDLYLSVSNLKRGNEGSSSEKTVVNIVTPAFNSDGHRIGVLMATLDWQFQTSILSHVLEARAREQFLLFNSHGRELLTGKSVTALPLATEWPDERKSTAPDRYNREAFDDHLLVFRVYDVRAHSDEENLGEIVSHSGQPWRLGIIVPRPTYGMLLLETPERLAGVFLIYAVSVFLGIFWMVSQHREHTLYQKTRQLADETEDLYENAPCGYHSLDATGRIIKINSTELEWLGYRADEVINFQRYRDFVTPETRKVFDNCLDKVFNEGKNVSIECELRSRNGHKFPVALKATVHVTDSGYKHSRAMVFDLTERKRIEALLVRQALTDPLTGLGNRRELEKQAGLELARMERSGNPLCLIAIDFDHFKYVNDTFGHDVGDLVLQAFSETAQEQLRAGDVVCRIGGEEFIALLPNTTKEQGISIAERLRLVIESTSVQVSRDICDDDKLHYTVSLGVTLVDVGESSLKAALKRADQAVYGAKEAGRNRVFWKGDDLQPARLAV